MTLLYYINSITKINFDLRLKFWNHRVCKNNKKQTRHDVFSLSDIFILLNNWNTGLKWEDSAHISCSFWCFPLSQHFLQGETFTPNIPQLYLTFRKMCYVFCCLVHCCPLDFSNWTGCLDVQIYTTDYESSNLCPCNVDTHPPLSLLSPSHLAFLVHLWHFFPFTIS